MKKSFLGILVATLVAFSACQNDELLPDGNLGISGEEMAEVNLAIEISADEIATRAMTPDLALANSAQGGLRNNGHVTFSNRPAYYGMANTGIWDGTSFSPTSIDYDLRIIVEVYSKDKALAKRVYTIVPVNQVGGTQSIELPSFHLKKGDGYQFVCWADFVAPGTADKYALDINAGKINWDVDASTVQGLGSEYDLFYETNSATGLRAVKIKNANKWFADTDNYGGNLDGKDAYTSKLVDVSIVDNSYISTMTLTRPLGKIRFIDDLSYLLPINPNQTARPEAVKVKVTIPDTYNALDNSVGASTINGTYTAEVFDDYTDVNSSATNSLKKYQYTMAFDYIFATKTESVYTFTLQDWSITNNVAGSMNRTIKQIPIKANALTTVVGDLMQRTSTVALSVTVDDIFESHYYVKEFWLTGLNSIINDQKGVMECIGNFNAMGEGYNFKILFFGKFENQMTLDLSGVATPNLPKGQIISLCFRNIDQLPSEADGKTIEVIPPSGYKCGKKAEDTDDASTIHDEILLIKQ